MSTSILVEEKVPGQPPSMGRSLTLPSDRITIGELIRIYVESQVELHNSAKAAATNGENYTSQEERLLNPARVDKRFRPVCCTEEVEKALVAFQQNKVFLLVEGKQATDLEEEIMLSAASKVSELLRGLATRSTKIRKMQKGSQFVQYEAVPLTEILPVVFSEVMRDVDLFVSVCSIGADPNAGGYGHVWHNAAFGELTKSAETRRDVLADLLPMLKIAARCSVERKYLHVQGDIRNYKIHLGTGNIMMEPNDEYLCIVASRGNLELKSKVFLPFEGDHLISIILSKAFLLAEDSKITDSSIVNQIRRKM